MSQAISETFVEIRAELDGLRSDLAKGNKMLGNMGKGVKFAGLTSAFTGITAGIGVIKVAAATIAAPFKLAFKAISTAAKIAMSILSKVFNSIMSVARMVGRAIGSAFDFGKQYIKGAIDVAMDFGEQMTAVGALTSTVGTKDFTVLREKALELGRATEFSATQAAMAMANFARTGMDVNEILGVIEPTLDFATANFLDLNEASDIAARVMGGMGLSAEDATRAMDALTIGANKSNQNVQDLGEAMKNVGSSAKQVGMEIEDAVAVLMSFAEAGRRGGEAGTALKQILLKIPSKTALKFFKELGVAAKDSATGGMRPLDLILDDLNKTMGGMDGFTQLEKQVRAFGTRAGPALSILLDAGGESIREYTKLIKENAGMAAKNAEIQRGDLKNAFRIVGSAADDLRIRLSDVLAPLTRQVYDNAVKALNFLSSFVQNKGPEIRDYLVGVFNQASDGILDALTVTIGYVANSRDKVAEVWETLVGTMAGVGAGISSAFMSFFGQDLVAANTGPLERVVLALRVAFLKIEMGFRSVMNVIMQAVRTASMAMQGIGPAGIAAALTVGAHGGFSSDPAAERQIEFDQRLADIQSEVTDSAGGTGSDLTIGSRARGEAMLADLRLLLADMRKGWSTPVIDKVDIKVDPKDLKPPPDPNPPPSGATAGAMSGTIDTVFGAFKSGDGKQISILQQIAKSTKTTAANSKNSSALIGAPIT
tara:strand:+ start:1954 stop:4083 length:2130 start_codon:yes stop_codon:yes gene_type:complete